MQLQHTQKIDETQLVEAAAAQTSRDEAPLERECKGGADMLEAPVGPAKTRIEELLEQQTHLMMKHLQLTEHRSNAGGVQFMFHTAKDMLHKVDPCVRSIFTDWHKDLRKKMNVYVTQSRLWNRYQQAAASDSLIRPFAEEAKKTWSWPESYCASAAPLCQASDGVDDGVAAAFAAMRQRHAREAQEFVMVHQKACVEQIFGDLGLALQCESLLQQVQQWLQLNGGFFRDRAQAEQQLTQQARCYAELVYREEMARADRRIKDANPPYMLIVALRVLCVLLTFVAPAWMSLERLFSVGAVLFSLVCGLGLFAEDVFGQSMALLLGPLPKYLALKMQLAPAASSVGAPRPAVEPPAPRAEELN